MNAGRLDRRLTVQVRAMTKDAHGGRVETWTESQKIWANLMPSGSGETIVADAERVTTTTKFKIRHVTIDATENRISYKGNTYQINGITEDGRRRTFLILDCKTISALT